MNKPILVVMAAGVGSRYSKETLKQIDAIGACEEPIMEFSVYDAKKAGFETVVFIISKYFADEFRARTGDKIAKVMEVRYAYQELDDLPSGYSIPEGRVKPWGTSHAIYAARDVIDAPFAVINADDYYGPQAYKAMYEWLKNSSDDDKYRFSMVSYLLKNTVPEVGSVSRGCCEINSDGFLTRIDERLTITATDDGGYHYTEDDGKTYVDLDKDMPVSMNFWGFSLGIMDEIKSDFPKFLDKTIKENPMKGEYLLPRLVDQLINEGKATVEALSCDSKWYGVTYHEDKESVSAALCKLQRSGEYPMPIFS